MSRLSLISLILFLSIYLLFLWVLSNTGNPDEVLINRHIYIYRFVLLNLAANPGNPDEVLIVVYYCIFNIDVSDTK